MDLPTGEDWVTSLENTDTPDLVVLEALKESLNGGQLGEFNTQVQKLLSSDTHHNILESTPLEVIPVLLAANAAVLDHLNDVERTVRLISQYGSAKEVLLVAQESLDALLQSTKSYDEEETSEDETTPGGDTGQRPTPIPVIWRWVRIIEMYTLAFPRLVLRKRSATDTAAPIVEHLQKSFHMLGSSIEEASTQGQEVVGSCIQLVHALLGWFDTVRADAGDVSAFKAQLRNLILVGVAECLSDCDVTKAHNEFLARLSATCSDLVPPNSLPSNESSPIASRRYTIGKFVLYTLSNTDFKDSAGVHKALKDQMHAVFLCLSGLRWRRTAIGWVANCIANRFGKEEYLEEHVATELVPLVSSVAATDSNPTTRGVSFSLLTQIILAVHPEVAFGLVRELIGEECPFPNMRASAVALLRQLVVRAFSRTPRSEDDPFAARMLLDEFATILFRSPLLEDDDTDLVDDQEMSRVVECLGLYNVLLGRDKENLTGVRDPEFTKETNTKFVKPLRQLISRLGLDSDDDATRLAIRATEVSLERVELAMAGMKL
ncbi:hypothetical protein BDV93DRAFT_607828 [Ceratobasidium sp. AG-I]|nr:hypothetical protein BDV93DRAFT_607828 [Ceratobasidium sp. AG-I]